MIGQALRVVVEIVARTWCNVMHPGPMWPMKGYYRCPRCHRKYRVLWDPVVNTAGLPQSADILPLEISPAFKAIATAVLLILAVPAFAQTARHPLLLPESGLVRTVQRELLVLPGYTMFDYLAAKQLEDGSVLLTGYVRQAALRMAAENAARSVAAGAAIVNRIEILPRSQSDERLRAAALREIYSDPAMLSYASRKLAPIHIVVKNGRVTLEGAVDSGVDRMHAETAMQHLPAVSVQNRLIAMRDEGLTALFAH